MTNNVETLVIDNFQGSMTEFLDGDINSGKTNIVEAFGYDSFARPGNLTWSGAATQIDPAGDVITDLVLDGKERVESGITYVYAIGHTGRLYKIQVNDPTTFNPSYDNPVLLATLTVQSPTFTRGGYMDFYGATEKIYIGHDKGVTSINFDGSGEAFVGALGSWTQNVPRPLKQFVGTLMIGNGENLAQIDSTATVTTYAKFDPAFPKGTQVRDLDVSVDGNYIDVVVSRLAQADITVATQDTSIISNMDSYIFKWNGTDTGYTAYYTFPSINMTANTAFGNSQYTFGYDLRSAAFFNPVSRITAGTSSSAWAETPFPNAISSDGTDSVSFAAPLYYNGFTELTFNQFGAFDWEIGTGFYAPFGMLATAPETDIIHVPFWKVISNFGRGSSINGYADQAYGKSKVYFSTLEASSAPTTAYRFYKWNPLQGDSTTAGDYNYYPTQVQLFSKKVQIKEVRVYGDPWVADNEINIDLIGSGASVMHTETMTAGSNLTIGDDYYWYNPQIKPTYALGLGIYNTGSANNVITKIEIDYAIGGK